MTQFNLKRLVNHRVHVSGADVFGVQGSTVLDSSQWDRITHRNDIVEAQAAYDEAVRQFWAPVNEALDQLNAANAQAEDPIGYVVLDEGNEDAEGYRPRVTEALSQDSIVLRLIEEGEEDRLTWVNGSLEVLEKETPATVAAAVETVESVLGGVDVHATDADEV